MELSRREDVAVDLRVLDVLCRTLALMGHAADGRVLLGADCIARAALLGRSRRPRRSSLRLAPVGQTDARRRAGDRLSPGACGQHGDFPGADGGIRPYVSQGRIPDGDGDRSRRASLGARADGPGKEGWKDGKGLWRAAFLFFSPARTIVGAGSSNGPFRTGSPCCSSGPGRCRGGSRFTPSSPSSVFWDFRSRLRGPPGSLPSSDESATPSLRRLRAP